MGYEIHVTRAGQWSENSGHEITEEEWLAYVRKSPDLSLEPANGPHFALWRGGASTLTDPWFDWVEGNIGTKAPDGAVVARAI